MFYFTYVLKSERNGKFYIGFTNNLEARMEKHNRGEVYWTKRSIPWRLIYYEAYLSKQDALERERQLKRFANGFAQLKSRLTQSLNAKGEG